MAILVPTVSAHRAARRAAHARRWFRLGAVDLADLDPGGGGIATLISLIELGLLVVLGVWVARRLRSRPCPRCGHRVEKGVVICRSCGFDFSTVGSTNSGEPQE
jgi:hypothetical protein